MHTIHKVKKKIIEFKIAQTFHLQVRKLKPREITLVYHDTEA